MRVALAQLQLVTLLGLVGRRRQVPVGKMQVVSGAADRRVPSHTWWAVRGQEEPPGKTPGAMGSTSPTCRLNSEALPGPDWGLALGPFCSLFSD